MRRRKLGGSWRVTNGQPIGAEVVVIGKVHDAFAGDVRLVTQTRKEGPEDVVVAEVDDVVMGEVTARARSAALWP